MNRDEPRESAGDGAGVEAEPTSCSGQIVSERRNRSRIGSGPLRRSPPLQNLSDQPDFDSDPQRLSGALPRFPVVPRAADQRDRDDRDRAIGGEFTLKKTDSQDQPEPERTAAGQPQKQHEEKWLTISTPGP